MNGIYVQYDDETLEEAIDNHVGGAFYSESEAVKHESKFEKEGTEFQLITKSGKFLGRYRIGPDNIAVRIA